MKSLNPLKDKENNIIDFLDSLDTDAKTEVENEKQYVKIGADNEETQNDEQDKNEKTETIKSFLDGNEEITALTVTKPNSLFVAQKMFKKSIKISIKSFLISLSLGFLNLFI